MRKNSILTCAGCVDADVRRQLFFEQQCSACRKRERNRLWRETHPGAMAANAKRWRAGGNKSTRPLGYAERHRAYNRQRYHEDPTYRASVKATNEKRRREKPDEVKAANKAWRAANLDHARKYQRDYARKVNNTPEGKEKQRAMRLKHRNNRASSQAAYNARRYGENGKLDGMFLDWLHKWQDHCCGYCNRPLQEKESIEHIVPLNQGGTNLPHNVILCCMSCNSSKRDKTLDVWRPVETYPALRFHSIYGTRKAASLFLDKGLPVRSEDDHLVLPNGKPLFVLSSFWLAERLKTPAVSLPLLAAQWPSAIFTFDFEWRERPDAMLNSISAKGGGAKAVGARELVVGTPTVDEAREFIGRWHMQGFSAGTWYVGLRDSEGWRGMCSVSGQPNGDYTLARVAFKGRVTGGFSRLVTALAAILPKHGLLVTFADNRLGDGEGYSKAGFVSQGDATPTYHYVNATGIYHWNAYTKTVMGKKLDFYDENWPAWRLAITNGLWRLNDLPLRRFARQTGPSV